MASNLPQIALIGNPNCGKTTLFNALTGSSQRIGNWPGVTVEKKEGQWNLGGKKNVSVVDLPGVYSLTASSEDERVSRDVLLSSNVDLVLNVIDSSNLERGLFLTTQILEIGIPVVVVLNMVDLALDRGIEVHANHLQHHLGVCVVSISAVLRTGLSELTSAVTNALEHPVAVDLKLEFPEPMKEAISTFANACRDMNFPARWCALKVLEHDPWVTDLVLSRGFLSRQEIENTRKTLEKKLDENLDIVMADTRYGFIHGLAKDVVERRATKESATDKIDRWVLGRRTGIPIFLFAMYGVFWVTISFGGVFIDTFDITFGAIFVQGFSHLLAGWGVPDVLRVFLSAGVGSGVQTVATFVPIIFLMFFMLSLLEDSGYMARAAFLMDRSMRKIGLPGKSFVPLLVGFGCTIPAIMSTRTLESPKDRYMTIFMSPFMSCGARLPVYALFASAFFGVWAGGVVFSLYVVGIVVAIVVGLLLKKTIFRGEASHFIMELPPYHSPRLGHSVREAWNRLKAFLTKAGIVIIVMVTVLGTLNSISIGSRGIGFDNEGESLMEISGKTLTPILSTMGVHQEDWPVTVGLFSGLFAKESIVGTLNALYRQSDAQSFQIPQPVDWATVASDVGTSLVDGLSSLGQSVLDPLHVSQAFEPSNSGDFQMATILQEKFSPVSAYAFLLFVLIYFPCLASMGASVKEMGWRLSILMVTTNTVLAWIVASLWYQAFQGHDGVSILLALGAAALVVGFYAFASRIKLETWEGGLRRAQPSQTVSPDKKCSHCN